MMGETPSEEAKRKSSKEKKKSPKKQPWYSDAEYKLRGNLPPDLPRRHTDIFLVPDLLNEQSERLIKYLKEGEEVWIHSVGNNIPLAINLVNNIRSNFGEKQKLESKCHSTTWENITENWEKTEPCYISGLHISLKLKT